MSIIAKRLAEALWLPLLETPNTADTPKGLNVGDLAAVIDALLDRTATAVKCDRCNGLGGVTLTHEPRPRGAIDAVVCGACNNGYTTPELDVAATLTKAIGTLELASNRYAPEGVQWSDYDAAKERAEFARAIVVLAEQSAQQQKVIAELNSSLTACINALSAEINLQKLASQLWRNEEGRFLTGDEVVVLRETVHSNSKKILGK